MLVRHRVGVSVVVAGLYVALAQHDPVTSQAGQCRDGVERLAWVVVERSVREAVHELLLLAGNRVPLVACRVTHELLQRGVELGRHAARNDQPATASPRSPQRLAPDPFQGLSRRSLSALTPRWLFTAGRAPTVTNPDHA
jgi:hypothetical protein